MRLTPPATRRVRVQVTEYQGSQAVKGSIRNLSVWEATSDEVADLILEALRERAGTDTSSALAVAHVQ
jgi:hypothetical protein